MSETTTVECFRESHYGDYYETDECNSLRSSGASCGGGSEALVKTWCVSNGQLDQARLSDKAGALNCMHDQQLVMEDRQVTSVVRRLTPLECERLQGFPDNFTEIGEWIDSNGKTRKCADTNRYKALGNSIALPYWKVIARRIAAQYDRDITMGSLFDGIGGFPLAFEHTGAKAVWASEIEEFCIAVTKRRFGEEGADDDLPKRERQVGEEPV